MGTFYSFRKAYGALKDSTKVGFAKVNSGFKDLDIAIVKATNHDECPPKECHVRKIFSATSVVVPRADVAYCIHTLFRRLSKTKNWIVAIKTLIVFHRILREGDPSFKEELLNYSERRQVFQVSNFKDDSSPLAWDCSAWVRTYGIFLEERLECFRMLGYDIESERMTKQLTGNYNFVKEYSRTRLISCDKLLEQLPQMQQLLFRLIGCQPEGAAYHNYLVQYALALVLKESFKIYCSINDGIINLVELFFDMPKDDAIKALSIYKKSWKQAEYLAELYEYCRNLDLARNFQFPTLKQPPPSFLATMEEYIRKAPSIGSVSIRRLEYEAIEDEQSEDSNSQEKNNERLEDKKPLLIEPDPKPEPESVPKREQDISTFVSPPNDSDLLGMQQMNPKAQELDENNALALSIFQNGCNPRSSSIDWSEVEKKLGWEHALVENNIIINNKTSQNNLVGGFDKFLLDSLYENDAARKQVQLHNSEHHTHYGYDMQYNPPMNVQMVAMLRHQQQMTINQRQQHQNQYSQLYQQPYQQQNMLVTYKNGHSRTASNPFGDGY
uniref:putative clathrin assembly protein At5g57200 n=1 Tax=Erigeron canadensis TaxID=72917 RepID=UPI001CB8BEA1|nr:putative clathrin assembly protein At5g57200 [Erigeron canadensis]